MNRSRRRESNRHGHILFIVLSIVISALLMGGRSLSAADIYTYTDEMGATYYTNVPGEDRIKVRLPIRSAKINERPPAKRGVSQMIPAVERAKHYEPAVASASRLFAVDPDIVRAVIKAESNYDAGAVSPKGAMGLMQLMPKTARELGVADPFDPVANIHGGVSYLSQLLGSLNGNLPLALAAYNAGPSRVMGRNAIPAIEETRGYVERVLNYYTRLKGRDEL